MKDPRVLEEEFIPSRVIHRDGQLKALRDDLKPVISGRRGRHSFLFGPPGTGKTCIARYVLEELYNQESIPGSYVNCWFSGSRFNILYKILGDLGVRLSIHRKGTPTDELLEIYRRKTAGREVVVILDEVDQLESDKILYDLLRIGNTTLILISNKETALYRFDDRVRSSLASADPIHFPKYSTREVFEILKDRVEWGLVPGTVKNSQLERIAGVSGGDARVALNILRIAAEEAESSDSRKIEDSHIERALPKVSEGEKNLEGLKEEQRILYEIIKERGEVRPSELYSEFGKRYGNFVDRTVRKYLEKLCRMGLVRKEGEGRWRVYRLA
ncbi:MAG: AAA family ATPase [Candidatus Aenigmatarchaeota archaeon]|nr:MAG: AAA family ATPase [Candidatus Aenigmarchaeota archaeon]